MKPKILLFALCLALSLLAGVLWALLGDRDGVVPPPPEGPLPGYPPLSEEGPFPKGNVFGGEPWSVDLSGLTRGAGRADPLRPSFHGGDPLGAERENTISLDIPPLLVEMASQLDDLRKGLEGQTLEVVARGLNALPGITASPDRARWTLRGDDVKLEVSIPAEDIRIDLGRLIP